MTMGILLYLLVPVVVAAVIIGMRAYAERRPRSIEDSINEFRRGLDALDPDHESTRRRRGGTDG
jgi:hypothetical protein